MSKTRTKYAPQNGADAEEQEWHVDKGRGGRVSLLIFDFISCAHHSYTPSQARELAAALMAAADYVEANQ